MKTKVLGTCATAPALDDNSARYAYLAVSGLLIVAYVMLELFGGHPLEIRIGEFAFTAPQAAMLLILVHLPFRKAFPRTDLDVLFYGALYIGAAALKLHALEDLAMIADALLGIVLFLAVACFPKRAKRATV